jgi:hypothetical protein
MIKNKKRGELTSGWLVTIILLVIGFGILLIFLYNMSSVSQLDNEVCHQSVIFRASLPSLAQNYVPLKCSTNKICITSGIFTGKCSEFEGEKGITTIKVSSLSQIEKVYAEQILSCWSMMGEGKISIFTQYFAENTGIGSVYPSCVICSRIALDKDKLNKAKLNLSNIDIEGYMMTHKVDNEELTYFEYMAGENGKYTINNNPVKILNLTETTTKDNTGKETTTLNVGTTGILNTEQIKDSGNYEDQLKETAVLFMQISAPKQLESAKNIGEMVLGGTAAGFFVAPTKSIGAATSIGKLCTSNGILALICGGVLAASAVYQQGSVAYNRAVTSGYCGDISMGTDARNGCSVVRTTNYDASSISDYCKVIESIP